MPAAPKTPQELEMEQELLTMKRISRMLRELQAPARSRVVAWVTDQVQTREPSARTTTESLGGLATLPPF